LKAFTRVPDYRARAVFAGGEMSFIAVINPGAITIESWKNFCDNPYGALCFRLIAGCKQSFCLRLDSVESAWHGKLHLLLLLKKMHIWQKGRLPAFRRRARHEQSHHHNGFGSR
jgi:hypothetical protein